MNGRLLSDSSEHQQLKTVTTGICKYIIMAPLPSIVIVKPCYRNGEQDFLFNEREGGECRKTGILTVSKPMMYVKKFKVPI
jgi:hypothetical protein